jgi:hypothetical protein
MYCHEIKRGKKKGGKEGKGGGEKGRILCYYHFLSSLSHLVCTGQMSFHRVHLTTQIKSLFTFSS